MAHVENELYGQTRLFELLIISGVRCPKRYSHYYTLFLKCLMFIVADYVLF